MLPIAHVHGILSERGRALPGPLICTLSHWGLIPACLELLYLYVHEIISLVLILSRCNRLSFWAVQEISDAPGTALAPSMRIS